LLDIRERERRRREESGPLIDQSQNEKESPMI